MTERQILLIKNSWSFVIVRSEESGLMFYERLFDIAPELQALFKSHPKEQALKFVQMITLVVSRLQKLDEILDELKALALRHNRYGVKTAYYRIAGAAFIWMLQQLLEDKWTEELEEAWIEVYTLMSDTMIKQQESIPVL
jgi:hemoglobin-like flavoprotein